MLLLGLKYKTTMLNENTVFFMQEVHILNLLALDITSILDDKYAHATVSTNIKDLIEQKLAKRQNS